MFRSLEPLTKSQRLLLGVVILLIVDVIRVASSSLQEYMFHQPNAVRVYFTTYFRVSLLILYLLGFICLRTWWQQCNKKNSVSPEHSVADRVNPDLLLSDPIYVPVKFDTERSRSNSPARDLNSLTSSTSSARSVRFNNLSEVRHLSESIAEEALLARMSWTASVRIEEARFRACSYLTVRQVAKVAFIFFTIFFMWNILFAEGLQAARTEVINSLWSTTGLFTLILAAIFPSSSADRFTLSKFLAVLFSICGMVLVNLQGAVFQGDVPVGALWAICGALLFAVYLVMLRRRAETAEKLNIPMLLGFMGFFTAAFLWPGFFIVHFSHLESFDWPDRMQWVALVVNGLVGTVLSELLLLWGCFLTTTLIATLSITLTIPMRMLADMAFKNEVRYNWMFYLGVPQVFLAFIAVAFLYHYDNWDPVLLGLRRLSHFIWRKRLIPRIRDIDRDQAESLMGLLSEGVSS